VGADRIVTLDVHNPSAFQNAFRCESIHLDTRRLFVPVIARLAAGRPVTVVSPDPGGVKRAQLLREAYEAETGAPAEFALLEKRRSRGIVSGDLFAGEVDGRAAFVVDDMISTGGTVLRAAEACRERGASAVYALAAHGLFAPAAERLLEPGALDGVVVTDSVAAPARLAGRLAPGRLEVVPLAPLMAGAIACLRGNGSLSDLLGMDR
jgi:ribose-phosphate pyrophosphokinase